MKLTGDEEAEREKFVASEGWFHQFQNCYKFKNIEMHEEIANADIIGAEAFQKNLRGV
jgi:hypothetical protein